MTQAHNGNRGSWVTVPELEALAAALWGRVTSRRKGELRFGQYGSKSLSLPDGLWFDHETNEGGDSRDLYRRVHGREAADGTPTSVRTIAATYRYLDETGTLLFEVVRYAPKSFSQRRPDGRGGWINNLRDVRRVLYRLPELAASDAAKPVFIVEGEKDVDMLHAQGLIATCNPGGAGKWRPEYNAHLADRIVVILPDNDEAGSAHAQKVYEALQGVARSVRIIQLPKVEPKGDVSDWLRAGHNVDELQQLLIMPAREQELQSQAEPIDLSIQRLTRRSPPPFPLAIFGAEWMNWIKNVAAASCCPADYVAAPLLAVASALIGNARWAQAWVGWEEPPHLWLASIGDSGDGKTPGGVPLFRHVLPELERRMIGDFPQRLREWETSVELARLRQSKWQAEIAKATSSDQAIPERPQEADTEPRPEEPRLVLHDVTIERVASILTSAAPKGLLMSRDELAGFLLGMNVYNSSARAFWLEAWGGGSYCVDRMKHPEPIKVPRLAVAWYGTTQPERLAELMQQPDDGLLARFVWCWPDPIRFEAPAVVPDIEFAIRALDRLRLLEMHCNSDGTLVPDLIPLVETARSRMVAFGNEMQLRRDLAAGLLRSSYGKSRGVALRVALLLEMLWWSAHGGYDPPPRVISDQAMEAATIWVRDYVFPMAERTFGDAACSRADRNIATLARWVVQKRPTEVHVRTMQREVRLPGLTEADAIHMACRGLVDAGWLLPGPRPHGNDRARAAYKVNSALWAQLQ